MIRTRIAAFAALAALSFGAIACGGDDADAFKEEYNAAVKPLSEANSDVSGAISGEKDQSNAVIAKDFQGLAQRTQQTRDNLAALDPPEDAKDAYDDLLSALKKGTSDLRAVAEAAKDSDPVAARTARDPRSNPPPRTSRRRSRGCGGLWTGSDPGAHRREQHDLRIELRPLRSITSRSMPTPTPPVGGIPCSSASDVVVVVGLVSSSPAASSSRCCSKRARCSSGSFSSVNALANSIPPAAKASQRSTRPASERWSLAKGESLFG